MIFGRDRCVLLRAGIPAGGLGGLPPQTPRAASSLLAGRRLSVRSDLSPGGLDRPRLNPANAVAVRFTARKRLPSLSLCFLCPSGPPPLPRRRTPKSHPRAPPARLVVLDTATYFPVHPPLL